MPVVIVVAIVALDMDMDMDTYPYPWLQSTIIIVDCNRGVYAA